MSSTAQPSNPTDVSADPGRRLYIETYGCQMNVADSELIAGSLRASGYRSIDAPENADVILLNTCAIREHAEQRVAQRVRSLIAARSSDRKVRIGLAGCMAQHHRDRLLDTIPGLDFIVGPDGYRRLAELLEADEPALAVQLDRRETYEDIRPARADGLRAWLTVMRGCDRFCTFCVVPFVRGRERSLSTEVLGDELRHIAESGFKEVVLLGQTVNAWKSGDQDFGDLLRLAANTDGIERVRFTSPHPADMTESTIQAMAECPEVMPYLHLPVQSGADAMLEAMDRGHTVTEYRHLVTRLRAAVPDLSLSTDIIVGYPGETEEHYQATVRLMEEIDYDFAYLFKYSPREGTRAFKINDTVSEAEKTERLEQLIVTQEERSARINQLTVGQEREVLVEGRAKKQQGWLAGKDAQFKTVVFEPIDTNVDADGDFVQRRLGDLARVRIEAAGSHTLRGVEIQGSNA